MTIDCTNLKPGDKVRLRNGDIDIVQRNDHDSVPIKLESEASFHFPDGRWRQGEVNDLDIVEILTNPEPEMDTTTLPFSWRYRLGTLELSDFTFRDPAKITINGKQYVPADRFGPTSIIQRFPYQHTYIVSATTNKIVAITCNGKRFTPADSWPEPITDRLPTEEDANRNGEVMRLDDDGNWIRYGWEDLREAPACGWAKTSDWKPTPLDKKALTIRDLMEAVRDGKYPDHDTLRSAIELLGATL
jgi:hypothetical protein